MVKERKERVRAALLNSRFEFPAGRITVELLVFLLEQLFFEHKLRPLGPLSARTAQDDASAPPLLALAA